MIELVLPASKNRTFLPTRSRRKAGGGRTRRHERPKFLGAFRTNVYGKPVRFSGGRGRSERDFRNLPPAERGGGDTTLTC